jgi:putative heme iron utilization protein
MAAKGGAKTGARQLLHLVFGGELATLDKIEFSDLKSLDLVGIYPNYAEAFAAWRDAAHRSVDDAHMRYFIVHLHRLLDPETETGPSPEA